MRVHSKVNNSKNRREKLNLLELRTMEKWFCSHGMALKGMAILLGISCFVFGIVDANFISGKKILEVRRKINRLKSQAVSSMQSEDGDIIDCIDIYRQPAFDHPALRNHSIQMRPSYDPNVETERKARKKDNESKKRRDGGFSSSMISQLWQKAGSCPKGTIPVRRFQERELLKTNSYGRKTPSYSSLDAKSNKKSSNFQQVNRSMAYLLTIGYSYSGVKGDIKVWNPKVEADDEYSTSHVRLTSGPRDSYESVESGWAVNPGVYGDRQTRLYVYWTADGSKTTGCFDLTCPGFVQTSSEIAIGAAIYPLSVPYGLPYQITIYIYKDPVTKNWWMQYGEKINVGYWPPELFSSLQGNAEAAEWGGEVYSPRIGQTPHTKTAMGNGNFPDYISGDSGSVKRMRVRENSLVLKSPEWVSTYSDEYRCYDVQYIGDYVEDPEFYYGGPGQNPLCP